MKRFIRTIALIAAAALALCACTAPAAEYGHVTSACAAHAQKDAFSAAFRLNITFENGTHTLLFSQGNYEASTENGVYVRVKAAQNYLGEPSSLDAEYKDGVYGATGEQMTPDRFFGQLLFAQPFVPESAYIASVKEASTGSGRGVVFELKDATGLLFPYLGESIYSAAMINKPRPELTAVKDGVLTLVPGPDGGIAFMTLNFKLILADTPPYVPGGADNQDEYTLELSVEYAVSFE